MQPKIKILVVVLAVAVIAVILSPFIGCHTENKASSSNFQVKFASFYGYSFNSQLKPGEQTQGLLTVNHTATDPITLTISGSAESWAYFARVAENATQLLAQTQYTLTERVNSVWLIVKVPENATAGAYPLTVTGNDNSGKTSSDTYTFTVT